MWNPAVGLLTFVLLGESAFAKSPVVCKVPSIADRCKTVHGRLQYGNGTPALRLWQIGTTHEFGIYSGLGAEARDPGDNEHPHLPKNVQSSFRSIDHFQPRIYADFEVCPLEPFLPGHMQAACIQSATHVVHK